MWLGNLDLNQDRRSQSPLYYRYTIPQKQFISMTYDPEEIFRTVIRTFYIPYLFPSIRAMPFLARHFLFTVATQVSTCSGVLCPV